MIFCFVNGTKLHLEIKCVNESFRETSCKGVFKVLKDIVHSNPENICLSKIYLIAYLCEIVNYIILY